VGTGHWPAGFSARGRPKNKSVRGRGQKKEQGQILFIFCFWIVFSFLLPSPRNVQKRDKKKRNSRFGVFGRFFCANSSPRPFCKTFFVVFWNSHRDKTHTKSRVEKLLQKDRQNIQNRFFLDFFLVFLGVSRGG
jgi:hypothetical protein